MDEGEPPLGERPAQDELEVSVAEARIAAALFGVKQEVRVGRYNLLDLVGRGGMSVVWGAWDPELERKVAIKLVDPLKATTRDRIVDEARALAKLSHPHVVPIYDVGVIDDRVYLVMEWVAGDNLRVHLEKPRTPREIVALYLQAARGLAAIHAAGLVHRDFKPDNAVVGADGRVRVLDFGLAKLDVDATTDIAGTPRYMAPEHAAGGRPTAAVDQFALCVSLREALEQGGRELPRWLAAIIARGTAPKPEDRFASMDALIRALERDPARVWARRAILGGTVVAAAVAFVVGRAAERETCGGSSTAIAADVRDRIAAHLDALGGFAAESRAALLARLDEHEVRLRDAVKGACVAHARGELTAALYDRRLTCLARARTSLEVSAQILESSTASTFPDARVAAGALVDPAACARVDESLVPLPDADAIEGVRVIENAIERARMLSTAARPEAIAAAAGARIAAEATGYQPVIGRALLAEGRALMIAEDERARTTLDRAMRVSFAAHDDASAVEAFARRAYIVSSAEDTEIEGASDVITPIADRLGSDGAFAQQLLLNNLAAAKIAASVDKVGARALLERALRAWRPARGENDYELVSILQNLAVAIDDRERSQKLLVQAHDETVRLFGRDHPRVLEIERFQIVFLELPEARALADSTCGRSRRLFPQLRIGNAYCAFTAAWLADEAGDRRAARAYFAMDTDIGEPIERLTRSSMVALMDGKATPELATQLEIAGDERAKDTSPWGSVLSGDAYIAAARIWGELGNLASSQRCWAKAVAVLTPTQRPAWKRRLDRARKASAT